MNEFYWLFGIVLTGLLSVIGYFLNKQINVIEKLTEVVGKLNVTVALLQNNQKNSMTNCVRNHAVIDKRLNSHSARLDELGIEITELKAQLQAKGK